MKLVLKMFIILLVIFFGFLKYSFAEDETGYIQNWYITGPFENSYLETSGVADEANFSPKIEVPGKKWRQYNFVKERLNLQESTALGAGDIRNGYLYVEIISPEKKLVKLLLASDDGLKTWFNGKLILVRDLGRGLIFDEDQVNIELQKGTNTLLCKVNNLYAGWELAAHIVNLDGSEVTDISYNPKNIAIRRLLPKKIYGTSIQQNNMNSYSPIFAIDQDMTTRWASDFYDPQYIVLEFADFVKIGRIDLKWELAFAKVFSIDISNDGATWETIYSENPSAGKDTIIMPETPKEAKFIRVFCKERATTWGDSLYDFGVYGWSKDVYPKTAKYDELLKNVTVEVPVPLDINSAVALSIQPPNVDKNEYFNPELAIDHNMETRWSSEFADPQWILLDLGRDRSIDHIILKWNAGAKGYKIEISKDNVNWKEIYYTNEGKGETEIIHLNTPEAARYIRLYMDRRLTEWGYSLIEIEPYGE